MVELYFFWGDKLYFLDLKYTSSTIYIFSQFAQPRIYPVVIKSSQF